MTAPMERGSQESHKTTSGRVVAIIPARGNSKGIPRKNLVDFCGRPLLSWSILQASLAAEVDEVFVSSEDPEILDLARQEGATPIERPGALSTDQASSESALEHSLDEIGRQRRDPVSLVVFLQATSPLREPSDIDGAVRALVASNGDSLFSACRAEHLTLWEGEQGSLRSLNFDYTNRRRRQDMKPQYLENGSVYVFRPAVLRSHGNRLGGRICVYDMPFWKSWEIDERDDVELCAWYFRARLLARFPGASAQPVT